MAIKQFKHKPFYIKLAQGILPTQSFLHEYNPNESPICPACGTITETNIHLFQCPCYTKWRKTFIYNLEVFFRKTNTPSLFSYQLI